MSYKLAAWMLVCGWTVAASADEPPLPALPDASVDPNPPADLRPIREPGPTNPRGSMPVNPPPMPHPQQAAPANPVATPAAPQALPPAPAPWPGYSAGHPLPAMAPYAANPGCPCAGSGSAGSTAWGLSAEGWAAQQPSQMYGWGVEAGMQRDVYTGAVADGMHVRYPYYSYRRPWYTPGPASQNVSILW